MELGDPSNLGVQFTSINTSGSDIGSDSEG